MSNNAGATGKVDNHQKVMANLSNTSSSLVEKIAKSVQPSDKTDITAATKNGATTDIDIQKKDDGDKKDKQEPVAGGDNKNLLTNNDRETSSPNNGKAAESGDKKETTESTLSISSAKDNNNNKDLSANSATAEKSSSEKSTTNVEDEKATKSSAANDTTTKGHHHAPLTTSHSQLSATAAPFVEGAHSMNFKSASKPRPLRMPLNANIPFAPGHTQLAAYAHQYLGPQHHFTGGSFHAQQQQQQQQSHQQQQQMSQQAQHNHHSQSNESLSTDEALEFMENINRSVKANQFSPALSSQISRLYNYLKMNGESMEQSHKNELNRVFVSLRQACCRDSGQLGTPCRLKMMELVELRAMGWRPSLSHSQYYLNRATTNGFQRRESASGGSIGGTTGTAGTEGSNSGGKDVPHPGDAVSSGEMEQLGAAPVSAPPYGHMAMNPFTFNLPGPVPDMVPPNPQMAPAAPSYYLIPASHIGHPPAGLFMGPAGAGAGGPPGLLPGPPPPLMPHPGATGHHLPLTSTFSTPASFMSMSGGSAASGGSGEFPKGAVTKSSTKFSRPTKIPGKNQFRDEVVIRNADSGKIMGVKGRRVSIIEEISKTIISFQKVMQGAKERTLTITGPNEESILQAKILIEDTIRRNVSPAREGEGELPLRHDLDGLSNHSEESDLAGGGGGGAGENGEQPTETECALAEMGSILKLSCANPAVLQVARRALNDYFHRHEPVLRRSSTADAYRYMGSGGGVSYGKERRKSMPLPLHALSNVTEATELEALTPKSPDDKDAPASENGSLTNVSKLNRSTPNLADERRRSILKPLRSFTFDEDKPLVFDENRPRVVYTREFLLQCAAHDASKTHPNILPSIAEQINEIVSEAPEKFDPIIYKRRCSDLKQVRF